MLRPAGDSLGAGVGDEAGGVVGGVFNAWSGALDTILGTGGSGSASSSGTFTQAEVGWFGFFGTLGYAFPAALGAKVARPEQPVVAVCGDGGFVVGCQELATAVEHGICLPVLVFNDGGYSVLRLMQDSCYDGRRIGVDLHAPDFIALAKAFGAGGLRVTELENLGPAMDIALAADGPTVIEITGSLMASVS